MERKLLAPSPSRVQILRSLPRGNDTRYPKRRKIWEARGEFDRVQLRIPSRHAPEVLWDDATTAVQPRSSSRDHDAAVMIDSKLSI